MTLPMILPLGVFTAVGTATTTFADDLLLTFKDGSLQKEGARRIENDSKLNLSEF